MKKIRRLDSHITLLEQRLRDESKSMNVTDLTREYMSDDLAKEFINRLKNIMFWRFAWHRVQVQ